MQVDKNSLRLRRKIRIRKKVSGTSARPRLVIYRSNTHVYAQIVNDVDGTTLASSSTLVLSRNDPSVHGDIPGSEKVGKEIARIAKEKNISKVVFDRNGYIYHGRVKALAEGARAGGLEF